MEQTKTYQVMLKMTYASFFVLALFLFTSFSVSALHHILLLPPGIYFTYQALKKWNIKIPLSFWALGAIVDICILSIALNWDIMHEPIRNLVKLKYYIIPLLGFFAVREWMANAFDEKKVRLLINTILISTTIATVAGLIGLWSGFNPLRFKAACHATRACGNYGMYMSYGYGISLFMILVTGLVLYRKKISHLVNKNILWTSFVVNMIGLYLAGARGAWLGYLGGVPFFFFHQSKKKFLLVGLGALLTLGAFYKFVPAVNEIFTSRSASNDQRKAFWVGAIKAWEEKPWLGYGYKNYEPNSVEIKTRYNLPYANVQAHAHSNFLEMLATTGGLGLLAFLLFQIFWFFENPFFSAFVASFFISGQVQVTWGDGENVFLIMAVWLISVLWKKKITSSPA